MGIPMYVFLSLYIMIIFLQGGDLTEAGESSVSKVPLSTFLAVPRNILFHRWKKWKMLSTKHGSKFSGVGKREIWCYEQEVKAFGT